MIYMVLGMHKSGTTLVSQIMHNSGINMGDDIPQSVSYDKGNKYERQSTLHLNMDILGIEDYSVLDVQKPKTAVFSKKLQDKMELIIQDCNNNYESWGFKDPRTPLVLPCWKSKLPEHKIVAIYRHPGEIWPRFRWTGLKRFYKNPILAWRYIKRWQEHNISILEYLNQTEFDFLLLNYNELITNDNEFIRLQNFLGIELNDQRNKDLFRSKKRDWEILHAMDALAGALGHQRINKTLSELDDLRQNQL